MNCQNFENILDDLARGGLMDARTREAALAHADSCRRCDARLADEKTLRAGLRSLASGDAGREAAPRVESALLAAFRAQAATNVSRDTNSPVNAHGNVAPLKRRADRQWPWVKTLATAATAAAAAAVLLMIIPPGVDTPPGGGISTVAEKTTGRTAGANRQVKQTDEPAPTHVDRQIVTPTPPEVAKAEPPRALDSARGVGRVTTNPVGYNPPAGRRAQAPRGGSRGARPDREVVTEFIPLGSGEYSASVDAGQVVRVELPRSALSSIGLPVSADRAGERIKADVLVGEDGLARAIRFVR
jgi:hypothetical protein